MIVYVYIYVCMLYEWSLCVLNFNKYLMQDCQVWILFNIQITGTCSGKSRFFLAQRQTKGDYNRQPNKHLSKSSVRCRSYRKLGPKMPNKIPTMFHKIHEWYCQERTWCSIWEVYLTTYIQWNVEFKLFWKENYTFIAMDYYFDRFINRKDTHFVCEQWLLVLCNFQELFYSCQLYRYNLLDLLIYWSNRVSKNSV